MSRKRTDPAVLSVRRRVRDQLRRENERLANRREQEAQYLFSDLTDYGDFYRQRRRKTQAIVQATSKLSHAVINSMGVTVPFSVRAAYSGGTSALTDFSSIQINVGSEVKVDDLKEARKSMEFVKGLIYHETGHIRFTVPFPVLIASAEQEAEGAADNQLMNSMTVSDKNRYHRAWNILEDQRMECAMVRDSGIMAQYFTRIVLEYVVKNGEPSAWAWVAGRTYLPLDVLRGFRQNAVAATPTDPTLVRDTSEIISRYKRATSAIAMMRAVVDFSDILERWAATGNGPTGNPSRHENGAQGMPGEDVNQRIQESASGSDEGDDESESEATTDGSGAGDSEGSDEQSDEQPSDGPQGSDNGQQESSDAPPSGSSSGETASDEIVVNNGEQAQGCDSRDASDTPRDRRTVREIAEDALQQAEDQDIDNSADVKKFMSDINEELNRDIQHNSVTGLLRDEDLAESEVVCNGMLSALEPLMDQTSPSWRFRQDDGVLDPTSFLMSEPGDTDYWVAMDGDGQQGYDLAVVVITDTSASMGSTLCRKTGIAARGIRKACDELEIPCVVLNFDNEATLLWDVDEEVDGRYGLANGGTNPRHPLNRLDTMTFGKRRQLVVILTDGQWDNVTDLSPWSAPGRYILLAGLGWYVSLDYLKTLNADEAFQIHSPLELPTLTAQSLSGFMR